MSLRREGRPASKKVLVIDDDPEMRHLEEAILAGDGYVVETVASGSQAIDRLRTSKYDGIVLDVMMPEMDGYETAKRIRQLPPNRQTPIIMVTGTAERGAMEQGFAAGVLVFLHKPFNAAAFRSIVQNVIG